MKYIAVLLITLLFLFNVNATTNEEKEYINSNNLITYLKTKNKLDDVRKICVEKYCSIDFTGNKEYEIKRFINKYINTIKKKSLDEGISAELKGVRITKIFYYDT